MINLFSEVPLAVGSVKVLHLLLPAAACAASSRIPSGSCPVGFVESPPDPSTAGFYPVDSQHLLLTWLALLILILLPLILTIYFQKRKDGRSS
jgi:hypothetical protein